MGVFAYGNTSRCAMEFNEDSFCVKKIGDYVVLMVADGNGSQKGMINTGALAISIMDDYLKHIIKANTSIKEIYDKLEAGMFTASRCFLSINAIDEKYANVYASLSVAIIEEISMNVVFASIGNTEIKMLRNGQITRINELFSEAYNLYIRNEISDEELYMHPKRAILTSALGVFEEAKVDILMTQLMKEDILLLTTDGLYRCMTPSQIMEILAENGGNIPTAVDKVLEKANSLECPDNSTLICCYVQDDNGVSIDRTYEPKREPIQPHNSYQEDSFSDVRNNTNDNSYSAPNQNYYDPYGGIGTSSRPKKKKKYLYD